MKKFTLPIVFAVYVALSGCASQNVLEPTPEEASKFVQHKLADVPSSQEALIYVINWTSNDKQRIRPLYALPVELPCAGLVKTGLVVLGHGLVEQRALGVARVVALGFGWRRHKYCANTQHFAVAACA
jgi:hypothetical protein